ncbi:DNA gyrase subunit A [Desulfallas sp. Bu1-1]|uniref:DNA gyrase subunit A n=1 Tax=Desulfallas sp. Bu1-1 TaxID=2787620 RepID=UPI00189FF466|nr:DNA gyrase subunit A [Desulfallas sp. Bu1-1]MBF7081366.1 DNA gyrase subunit A [Desulfallas sp. Bu1-1]
MPALTGKVIPININDEMKHSYLDYAMSVIVGRALPDVRDGLKPVHRRILYAMHTLGVTPDKPHRKSAYIVGEVMAKYHPHGDSAIYDTLVRLAQDFSSRYPLVDGHGNFGSVDGDAPAAMRYTEARLAKIATEMLADIEKETVDFIPNYDDSANEPVILPSRFPNLLVNGSAGIAVGMATNIPPHNLSEVIDGVVMLIDNPEAGVNDLMQVIKGPDFPSSGIIMGREGIKSAYKTGRGTIIVRAKAEIEETGKKTSIIVTELPYQVNKAKLVEKIADLVKDKKIDGITDLRDESDRHGMRIVIELRRDANPRVILNQLYKYTQMQDSFGVIMLALVNGEPKILNLRDIIYYYLEHQKEIIVRRTKYDLRKAEERAHIVEGLRIALANLDEVIKIIRGSRTVDEARTGLMERFNFTELQAQAILDMRLHRLTGLERDKLEAEYKELIKKIEYFRSVLADEKMVLAIIKQEIMEIKDKYGDKRRTSISTVENIDFEVEDLILEEDVVVTITNQGYIKRMPLDTYRSQRRGGRGIHAMGVKEDDFLRHLFIATTHHYFLFFTNKGKVYRLKGHEIPEAGRQARGTAIVNLLYIDKDEYITTVIPVRDFEPDYYLFMATRNGIVKKTPLTDYDTSRRDGIIAINLDEGDNLVDVLLTDNSGEVIIGTKYGMAIRFPEDEVRPTGRVSRGVKGITLRESDQVVSVDRVRENSDLLVVTSKGYGKRTRLSEYRVQSRGGIGITNIKCTHRNGHVVALQVIAPGEEIMMISADGIMIRLKADNISLFGRATQGVLLMKLGEGDYVVSVARVVAGDDGGED